VDPARLDAFFTERERARGLFFDLITDAKAELEEIFAAEGVPVALRRRAKAEAYARLKARYRAQRHAFGDYNYDGFFNRDLNNAHLVSIGTYENARPALEAVLFGRFGGNMIRFLMAMEEVAKADEDWRLALARARP
jgi:predicted aminopeptidase